MFTLEDLKRLSFPGFDTEDASLVVFEGNKIVPFNISRVFTVKATKSCIRGFHAHKECAQVLVLLNGKCKVTCDDGENKKSVILNKLSEGLLIPPTIWAEQEYDLDTILMVIADKPYDKNDYLRNYNDFLNFRKYR